MNVLIEFGFELLEMKESLAASTTIVTQVCWNVAFRSDLVEEKVQPMVEEIMGRILQISL